MADVNLDAEEPRITEIADTLERFQLRVVRGVVFEDQEVHVDGRSFVGCVFRRCNLRSRLGIFDMDDGCVTVDCTIAVGHLFTRIARAVAELEAEAIRDAEAARRAEGQRDELIH